MRKNRTQVLQTRATPEEAAGVREAAALAGLSVSAYIRTLDKERYIAFLRGFPENATAREIIARLERDKNA